MEYKRCLSVNLIIGLLISLFAGLVNAAVTIETQIISTDTTWSNISEPYEVTGAVTVASGITLTISAGAELKFASGASLIINGTILAQGEVDSPIVFQRLEQSQSWGGVTINSGLASTIKYAHIRGAGNCLNISVAAHNINHNVLTECSTGLYIASGAPNIFNNLIVKNNSHGINIQSGTPQIENNLIAENSSRGI